METYAMPLRNMLLVLVGLSVCLVASSASAAGLLAKPVAARLASANKAAATQDNCTAQTPAACQPCIVYRHHGPKLCCDNCAAPIPTIIKVKDPCSCCEVDVQVCLPACCSGDPTVCCGTGFLGRNVVEYEWCCGYSVRVAFRHCGDVLVTTWGR